MIAFADQQMSVLGHDHISDYRETVTHAGLFQNLKEEIPAAGCAEQRTAAIATRSDEMQISAAVGPAQPSRHGTNLDPDQMQSL